MFFFFQLISSCDTRHQLRVQSRLLPNFAGARRFVCSNNAIGKRISGTYLLPPVQPETVCPSAETSRTTTAYEYGTARNVPKKKTKNILSLRSTVPFRKCFFSFCSGTCHGNVLFWVLSLHRRKPGFIRDRVRESPRRRIVGRTVLQQPRLFMQFDRCRRRRRRQFRVSLMEKAA